MLPAERYASVREHRAALLQPRPTLRLTLPAQPLGQALFTDASEDLSVLGLAVLFSPEDPLPRHVRVHARVPATEEVILERAQVALQREPTHVRHPRVLVRELMQEGVGLHIQPLAHGLEVVVRAVLPVS